MTYPHLIAESVPYPNTGYTIGQYNTMSLSERATKCKWLLTYSYYDDTKWERFFPTKALATDWANHFRDIIKPEISFKTRKLLKAQRTNA